MKKLTKLKSSIKNSYHDYLQSFKSFDHKHFLIDLGTIFGISLIIYLVSTIIQFLGKRMLPTEMSELEIKSFFLTSTPVEVQKFTQNLKFYVILFFIIIIIAIFLILLTYTFSRRKIWSKFVKHQNPKLRKWVGLGLLLSTLILILLFPLLIINGLITKLVAAISFNNPNYIELTNSILILLEAVLLLLLIFITKIFFFKTGKVWGSVGESFGFINRKKKVLLGILPYLVLTLFIINSVVMVIINKIFPANQIIVVTTQLLILALFMSWSRNYLWRSVKG